MAGVLLRVTRNILTLRRPLAISELDKMQVVQPDCVGLIRIGLPIIATFSWIGVLAEMRKKVRT